MAVELCCILKQVFYRAMKCCRNWMKMTKCLAGVRNILVTPATSNKIKNKQRLHLTKTITIVQAILIYLNQTGSFYLALVMVLVTVCLKQTLHAVYSGL